MGQPFCIGGREVAAGQRCNIDIPLARLYTHTVMSMPVEVLHGKSPGARLFVSAALHGDEINGVEIVRRVLERVRVEALCGTLVAVPIVNVFGFVYRSRYLPDRRDLNRSFPGSQRGSLASRLAHLFMREIVGRCTHGIDLHTAAPPRINLPQVRANLKHPETRRCAEAFGASVMIHGRGPGKSLRNTAIRRGLPLVLYEAGEPHRFNEDAIQIGVEGVLRVMSALGMRNGTVAAGAIPLEVTRTRWVRAQQSGIFRLEAALGGRVCKGEELGTISDPFGGGSMRVRAATDGLVIGHTNDPLVHRGDAILHLAVGV